MTAFPDLPQSFFKDQVNQIWFEVCQDTFKKQKSFLCGYSDHDSEQARFKNYENKLLSLPARIVLVSSRSLLVIA